MVSLAPSGLCDDMIAKPKQKCFSIDFARRHLQYNSFLLVHEDRISKPLRSRKTSIAA